MQCLLPHLFSVVISSSADAELHQLAALARAPLQYARKRASMTVGVTLIVFIQIIVCIKLNDADWLLSVTCHCSY